MAASELKDTENQLRGAGFTEPEILRWRATTADNLRKAGFGPGEVEKAFGGTGTVPNLDGVRKQLGEKFAQKPVNGIEEALKAGWGSSVTSLMASRPEDIGVLHEDSDFTDRIAYQTAMLAGDFPWMVAGGMIGGGVGTAGSPVGTVIGTMAGAFALPAGLRATLMDSYEKGEFKDIRDFISRTMGIMWETTKGYATGAATGVAGVATKAALPAGASALTKIVAPTAAELATMVTVGKALEGELPKLHDFTDAAVLFAGFKGSVALAGKFRSIYREGALKPEEVISSANEVSVRQDLADVNTVIPRALENLAAERGGYKPEPKSTEEAPSVEKALALVAKDDTSLGEVRARQAEQARQEAAEARGETYEHGDAGTPRAEPMDPAKAQAEVKAQIGKRPEPVEEKISFSKLYTEVKDALHPIKELVDVMNAKLGRKLPPEKDPYVLLRLLAGNSGKFKQVVELNLYDTNTMKNIGPGLEARLEPVKNDLSNFQAYMLAKRAMERINKGQEVGITREQAKAIIKEAEEKEGGAYLGGAKTTFKKVFDSLNEFQEQVGRQFLVNSGVMSEAQFLKFLDTSKDFVPVHRVHEEILKGKKNATGIWKSVQEEIPKGAKMVRPIETILRNTYLYIALGEKNRAGLALLEGVESVNRFQSGTSAFAGMVKDAITDVPGMEPLARSLPAPEGGAVVLRGAPGEPPLLTVVETTKPQAMVPRTGRATPEMDFVETLQPLFDAMTLGQGDKITVFRNGERITLKAAPEVAEVFHGLDAQSMGVLLQIFSLPAQMLRAGVTLAPEYAARNIIVDQPIAGIMSKHGYVPFLSMLRSISHVFKADEVYQRWLKSGGANVALVSMDARYVESKFAQWAAENHWYKRVWNSVELNYVEGGAFRGTAATIGDATYALFAPLRIASQMSDTLTRLGEMRLADKGEGRRSAIGAGFDTREVTQDFLRQGSALKAFNALTAFANAQLEGVDRTARAFKDRPGATMFKIGGMVMLPTLMLWLNNKDEQWYKDMPDYIRDNFWLFKAGGHIYKVRKPFEIGTIFASGLERSLEAMFTDEEESYKSFAHSVLGNLAPNMMPTFAQPVVENVTNHSFFNGRPLIPENMERLLPEYQYTPYTSETAKAIGSVIGFVPNVKKGKLDNLSPIVVDNYIRQWSGGMGQYVIMATDQALIKAGVVPDPVKPTKTLEEMPVIRSFMVRYPSNSTKSIQDFYQHYDAAVKHVTTVREMARRGNAEAAIRLSERTEDIIKLDGVHRGLGNASKTLQTIHFLPDITPDEKRQLIETIYFNMTVMGRAGADAAHRINRALKVREEVQ